MIQNQYEYEQIENYPLWLKIFPEKNKQNLTNYQIFYFYNQYTQEQTPLHPEQFIKSQGEKINLKLDSDTYSLLQSCKIVCQRLGILLEINNIKGKINYYAGAIYGLPTYNMKDLQNYLKILQVEINIYDKFFIEKANLRKIILCQKLKFCKQERWGIPIYKEGILYLNIDKTDIQYLKNTIHHEFYHIVDYSIWKQEINLNPDEKWNKLNNQEFQYQNEKQFQGNIVGGGLMRDPKEAYKKVKGFRNQYSQTCQSEDKAEIWAAIILYPLFGEEDLEENNKNLALINKKQNQEKQLDQQIIIDDVVFKKVKYMKDELMIPFFESKFFMKEFWKNILNLRTYQQEILDSKKKQQMNLNSDQNN